MQLSTKILIGLSLGLISGVLVSLSNNENLTSLSLYIAPVGSLWVNAIRMTIIPLLMALLITAVAGEGSSGKVLELGGKTLGVFVIMILCSSGFAVFFASPLIMTLGIDPDASAALLAASASSANSAAELPPFSDWLVALVPANPIAAAAAGDVLPLMIFTGLFAVALLKLGAERYRPVLEFFTAVREAMFVLIHWIMLLAPYGIFALVFPLTVTLGVEAISALTGFLIITCSLIVLLALCLYPLVWLLGTSPIRFARVLAPVQVIGFSTRSSLAALPATIGATATLGVPGKISGLVLPIAVTLFKFTSPLARTAGTYFIAVLYGIDLEIQQLLIIALAIGLLSFYSPGIPSGGLLIMTPVYVSLGLPVEGIGILIAVDLIVDMFISAANVTANATVALLVARIEQNSSAAA